MKIGDKRNLTRRFDSGWWVWDDGTEPQGPHHLPSGVVAIVKELKDEDVIFSIIYEDGLESKPVFRTKQNVFEDFFEELAEREK